MLGMPAHPVPGEWAWRGPDGGETVANGTVKWFSEQKGYGFIKPDEGEKDIFVHYSNITLEGFKTLRDGQRVEYESVPGRRGLEATNVKPEA